jgi:hypothetical protein
MNLSLFPFLLMTTVEIINVWTRLTRTRAKICLINPPARVSPKGMDGTWHRHQKNDVVSSKVSQGKARQGYQVATWKCFSTRDYDCWSNCLGRTLKLALVVHPTKNSTCAVAGPLKGFEQWKLFRKKDIHGWQTTIYLLYVAREHAISAAGMLT